MLTITNEFHLRTGDNQIIYDSKKASTLMDLTHNKKLVGLYIRDEVSGWCNINYYSLILISPGGVNIYFHKTNIPLFLKPSSSSNNIYSFTYDDINSRSIPFMLFSNDIIEPVPYFDITKMKYIKQYIVDVMKNTKLVYMIYKYHNMIFIYNSHIIYNDMKQVFTYWDDKLKKFYCDFNIIPPALFSYCREIDFASIIGDYKNTLIYEYIH
jgi:hypothetical protein